jgi:RNA polymerase sigma factor (sigma-70 family)
MPPGALAEVEREQLVRDAIADLPPRCREVIELLFFEHPPVPYSEIAKRLGMAPGSIAFIRGRCLKRLRRVLEEGGF